MTTSAPISHRQEAKKLTADALVDLWEIYLRNSPVVVRLKNENTATWQGNTYEGMAIQMSGDTLTADPEEARPTLKIMNPAGIFNSFALDGTLDMATVIRKRVLGQHLESNAAIFQQRMWYVSRIKEILSGQSIQFELRNMTEGPLFMIPARMYMPPEFRTVSLR